MLKRSIGVLVVVGCVAGGAMADAIIEYSPTELDIGVETTVSVSITDNTGAGFGLGGVILEFANQLGPLSWDLNGPDNVDFTDDDGFRWQNGLDGGGYFSSVDPAQAVWGGDKGLGLQVPANGTVLLFELDITGSELGEAKLKIGNGPDMVFNDVDFGSVPIDDGTEALQFNVVPEPASLSILALGALALVRRSRR